MIAPAPCAVFANRIPPEAGAAVVVLPALAALTSLACALVVTADGLRRPKPDKAAWSVAFAVFALAAGTEVVGEAVGWTPFLARVYYLAGATLVVGYLALGELYLLAPRRTATVGPGAALLVTALAAALVLDAPVDGARLTGDGWQALERGPALVALTASINALGTLVVVGGALISAWRFWRRGVHRHRMIGCLLIALGTLLVAAGGTLTRFGLAAFLYPAMAAGVAVIFVGYLEARRPDAAQSVRPGPFEDSHVTPVTSATASEPVAATDGAAAGRGTPVPLAAIRGGRRSPAAAPDPAIAFLETHVLPLDDAALAEAARAWSVERAPAEHFGREEARRAWALRLRLSPAGREAFDAHGVPAKRQVAELYHEVLAPGVAELAEERRAAGRGGA